MTVSSMARGQAHTGQGHPRGVADGLVSVRRRRGADYWAREAASCRRSQGRRPGGEEAEPRNQIEGPSTRGAHPAVLPRTLQTHIGLTWRAFFSHGYPAAAHRGTAAGTATGCASAPGTFWSAAENPACGSPADPCVQMSDPPVVARRPRPYMHTGRCLASFSRHCVRIRSVNSRTRARTISWPSAARQTPTRDSG